MQLSLFNDDFNIDDFNKNALQQLEGLSLHAKYITLEEEKYLINEIDKNPWLTDLSRRVQHYGYKYDYKARKIDNSFFLGELPQFLKKIGKRLFNEKLIDFIPDQAIINEYEPGQGISQHIDCEPCFGDIIISLSLGSSAIMTFTKEINSKEKIELFLDRNSLLIMSGISRYKYYHGIPARKKDNIGNKPLQRQRRLSITFRKINLNKDKS